MSNRLSSEKSPYLLQHRDNPVDWYPWCSEAFERAKEEDKPILLSIGYSTCHWCHVMGRESFEVAEIAEILNSDFISIKVDREERPDIDAIYMRACQAMTGSGGWPLTILMTPAQKPFFAATYLPKDDRYGQPGFRSLLLEVSSLWHRDRQSLLQAGEELTAALKSQSSHTASPGAALIGKAADTLSRTFDRQWGGFGQAPKFPAAHNLLFLLELQTPQALTMAEATLSAMARGGIFDHIGGGFARYSTDRRWLIPHFEKMLYDNALLLAAYAEAFRRTKNDRYADTARRTADYMLRELQLPEGGLCCGQDADSEGVEGKYYALTPDEIRSILNEKDAAEFCRIYGIGEKSAVPNLIFSDQQPWSAEDARLQSVYAYRRSRTALRRDDKVLLAWNAWAIYALADSSRILCEDRYLAAAIEIHRFIETHLTASQCRLYHRYCRGEAAHAAQLDDYAVYALALLRLYRATFDVQYLEQAAARAEQMLRLFAGDSSGLYLTANDAEPLIDRPKETYDGAMPSGNSVAALVFETLAQLSGDGRWREAADRQMRFVAGAAEEYPAGHCFGLLAMQRALHPADELIVCADSLPQELHSDAAAELNALYRSNANAEKLAQFAPFTAAYPIPERGAMWYLCRNGACRKPAESFAELEL